MKYGLIADTPDRRDDHFVSLLNSLPIQVDLRPKMPPVYDQGDLGSCTANAICAAIEYDRIAEGKKDWSPSRLFVYYNERAMENTVMSDAGAQIRDGIKSVASKGVCPEVLWPYDISKFTTAPSTVCYEEAVKYQAVKYQRVAAEEKQIKGSLVLKIPVICGISLYESFESPEVAETGIVDMPSSNEKMIGGHAVLVVGYNDITKKWIMRNSWGESWGDRGYFHLPYEYLENNDLVSDMWAINLVK